MRSVASLGLPGQGGRGTITRPVTLWNVEKEWDYEGSGEPGADVEGGHAFRFKHSQTGEEREFSIEVAAGGPGVPYWRIREVRDKYLDDPDPPRRVKLDRDGNEIQ